MKRKIPLILLCLVFLGIAGYFGLQTYRQWSSNRDGDRIYADLTQYVTPAEQSAQPARQRMVAGTEGLPEDPEADPAEATAWPQVDFEALRAINPDIVAWILIEGTNINYPVVRGADNSYYLDTLFDGSQGAAGTIFMDYRNEADLSDTHTVLYGHHMKNGSMFKQIALYKEQSFYEEHPTCLIMTPEGNYTLEWFAGYVTDINSQAWKRAFASPEEYAQWLAEAQSRSAFTSAVEVTPQDRVVTFSTCSYEFQNARFVLVGVLRS